MSKFIFKFSLPDISMDNRFNLASLDLKLLLGLSEEQDVKINTVAIKMMAQLPIK
jgi:hypothetical protein